jgi:magnesium-transporting ATPase (P-type)
MAVTMATLALVLYSVYSEKYDTAYGQTIVFTALVAVQWANAFNARSTYDSLFTRIKVWHAPFWIGLAIAVTMQMLALFGPLQEALYVNPVAIGDIFLVTLLAFVVAVVPVEIHKWYGRHMLKKREVTQKA